MRLEDFDNDEDKIIQDRLTENMEWDSTNDSWILKLVVFTLIARRHFTFHQRFTALTLGYTPCFWFGSNIL
jgi:hypothetical protein